MQKNTRDFRELDPAKIGGFAKEEKQFSEAYLGWSRRFILFHNKKHPLEMGALEVELYLTHLAVGEKVSANTQKQALNGLASARKNKCGCWHSRRYI